MFGTLVVNTLWDTATSLGAGAISSLAASTLEAPYSHLHESENTRVLLGWLSASVGMLLIFIPFPWSRLKYVPRLLPTIESVSQHYTPAQTSMGATPFSGESNWGAMKEGGTRPY